MPRNMSFAFTIPQMVNKTKTVTRRIGWEYLKPGDIVNAVERVMGFKKGEKIKIIGQIKIISVSRESLFEITREEVDREGFPKMSVSDFIKEFCYINSCKRYSRVTRIEFEHKEEL